jgi:hypothetical protein
MAGLDRLIPRVGFCLSQGEILHSSHETTGVAHGAQSGRSLAGGFPRFYRLCVQKKAPGKGRFFCLSGDEIFSCAMRCLLLGDFFLYFTEYGC